MTMTHQREFEPTLIRGEHSALEPTPLKTEEVIVTGYDINVEQPAQQKEETEEYKALKAQELLEEAIQSELHALDGWLLFKVKGEVVAQLYTTLGTDVGLNISSIQNLVSAELESEKAKNAEQAERIMEEIIPVAAMIPRNPFKGADGYWVEDIDNLQRRVEVNKEVVSYIEAVEATGEEGLYDFTENLIKLTHQKAREEVIGIFREEKTRLENRDIENQARIEELQDTIIILKAEVEFAKEPRVDANIAPNTLDLISELTHAAKSFAR